MAQILDPLSEKLGVLCCVAVYFECKADPVVPHFRFAFGGYEELPDLVPSLVDVVRGSAEEFLGEN